MQSNAPAQTNHQNSLILDQIHLRTQLREAEEARETELNERIASLEERLQSILQTNRQIEVELNQTRALYEQRQQCNSFSKQSLLVEIRPLEYQVNQLTPAIAALIQTNAALDTKVETARVLNEGIKSINAQVDIQLRGKSPFMQKLAFKIKHSFYIAHGLDKAL